ncbi:MAG: glycosyltransferase family 4 protein [Thermoplasmata archaeon]
MRILQVSPFFYPHAGGVESHVRGLARELAREGHDVTVLTSRHERHLPAVEELEGYRIVRARTLGVLWNTPIDPSIARAVRDQKADVVHLHYPPPLTSYFAARALLGTTTPTVLTYHCDLYLPGVGGRMITALYERLFLPLTLGRVDRIIAHTRSYAITSVPLRARRVDVIPSSVDVERFRPDVDGSDVRRRLGLDGRRVLAFTGRLVPHKGVDAIVRVLPSLPDDVVLLVVGRGPRLDALTSLARRLNVEDRVRFCPAVPDEELPAYLRVADLFVFPSQNRLEGFGLAVAEAMAAGLPVVTADMPGVREVIEPGVEGLLVEPLLGGDLAARLIELLDDPERRGRMGAAARRRAEERYALPVTTRALIDVYRGLTEAG